MKNELGHIRKIDLDCGPVCYVIQEHDRQNRMAICLTIKAGSVYEQPGQRGWFHFLEHLLIYPFLYKCVNEDTENGKFRAFDYACTSFNETSFWFHASDGNGELLIDSIKTARGILEGYYLTKEAFGSTRKDILQEYCDYEGKRWFKSCCAKLQERGVCLPIGERNDILKADYEQLVCMHRKYYRAACAALFIATSKEVKEIEDILKEIFKPQSHLYLAWLPRKSLPLSALMQSYMELAMTVRAVELFFQKLDGMVSVECSVEIFGSAEYLFKLEIVKNRNWDLKSVKEVSFSHELFEKAMKAVGKQLAMQYDPQYAFYHGEDNIEACKEHFLYGEPIINLENEYAVFHDYLLKCQYENVKRKYDALVIQFMEGWNE